LVDTEKTLVTRPLFSLDAGGPLFPPGAGMRSITLPDNPGLRPVAGRETRWARALAFFDTPDAESDQFIFPLTGSTDFIVGGPRDVSRYSADGALLWSQLNSVPFMADGVPHPDGGFVMLSREGFAISRHDGQGVRQWSLQRIAPNGGGLPFTQIVPAGLASRPATIPGQLEYFNGGWYAVAGNNPQPFVAKCDDSGTLLWLKRYDAGPEPFVEITHLSTTADGDVLLSGIIDPTQPSPALGFILKVDGDTGAPLWGRALNSTTRGSRFGPVAEDSEGNVYAGGTWGINVLDKLPLQLVAKFSHTGESLGGILFGSVEAEGLGSPISPTRPVPTGGETIFDRMQDLTWHDGHLWACGRIGVGSFVLGLSNGQAGYTMRLSPDLEIDRFALHAGTGADSLSSIRGTTGGILVSGNTRSILPWPGGHIPNGGFQPLNANARLVMKLPMEGLLRFHDTSNAAQPARDATAPAAGSHYVYPRVFSIGDVAAFLGALPVSFTAVDLTLAPPVFTPGSLAHATPLHHYQIEYVPPGMINSWDSHLAWHQQDAQSNTDGDGLDFASEFYHGTDPGAANAISLTPDTHPVTGLPTQPAAF
jgi:hypothetical protein